MYSTQKGGCIEKPGTHHYTHYTSKQGTKENLFKKNPILPTNTITTRTLYYLQTLSLQEPYITYKHYHYKNPILPTNNITTRTLYYLQTLSLQEPYITYKHYHYKNPILPTNTITTRALYYLQTLSLQEPYITYKHYHYKNPILPTNTITTRTLYYLQTLSLQCPHKTNVMRILKLFAPHIFNQYFHLICQLNALTIYNTAVTSLRHLWA
jgi:hypothetical protein